MLCHRTVKAGAGVNVENGKPVICGKFSARYLNISDRFDYLFFAAHRVFCRKCFHFDTEIRSLCPHNVNGVGLIFFYAHGCGVKPVIFHYQSNAAYDEMRIFEHSTVVCGYIRFALRAVDDDMFDFSETRTEFEMQWKSRAAHSGDTRFAGSGTDYLGRHCVKRELVLSVKIRRVFFVEKVIFYNYARCTKPGRNPAGFNSLDRSRNRCVNGRGNGRLRIAYLLSEKNPVPDFDKRLTRCADMLRKRNDKFFRRGQNFYRRMRRHLVVCGVYSPSYSKSHNFCFFLFRLGKNQRLLTLISPFTITSFML